MPKITADNQQLALKRPKPYIVTSQAPVISKSLWQPFLSNPSEPSTSAVQTLPVLETSAASDQSNYKDLATTFVEPTSWSVVDTVDATQASSSQNLILPASILQNTEHLQRMASCKSWKEKHVDVAFRIVNKMLNNSSLTQEHAHAFLEELIKGMLILDDCRPGDMHLLFERFRMQIDFFKQRRYSCKVIDEIRLYLWRELKSISAFFSFQRDVMRFGFFLQTYFPKKFDTFYTRTEPLDSGVHGEVVFAQDYKKLKEALDAMFTFDNHHSIVNSARRYRLSREKALACFETTKEQAFAHLEKIIDQALSTVPIQWCDEQVMTNSLEIYLSKTQLMRSRVQTNKPIVSKYLYKDKKVKSDLYFDKLEELFLHKETILKGLIGRIKMYSRTIDCGHMEPGTLISAYN